MSDRDLKLNSLSRYAKESPQLVLEEHGHCEVPAGCGGAVLRWRSPHSALWFEFWRASNGEVSVFVDGTPLRTGRATLSPGEHVLAFRVSQVVPGSGVLMFAAVYDEDEMRHTALSRRTGDKIRVVTSCDGSWRYTTSEPADESWTLPGFDDSTWGTMTDCDLPVAEDRGAQWRRRKLTDLGARGLGVTESADRVWIRRVLRLSWP